MAALNKCVRHSKKKTKKNPPARRESRIPQTKPHNPKKNKMHLLVAMAVLDSVPGIPQSKRSLYPGVLES